MICINKKKKAPNYESFSNFLGIRPSLSKPKQDPTLYVYLFYLCNFIIFVYKYNQVC